MIKRYNKLIHYGKPSNTSVMNCLIARFCRSVYVLVRSPLLASVNLCCPPGQMECQFCTRVNELRIASIVSRGRRTVGVFNLVDHMVVNVVFAVL